MCLSSLFCFHGNIGLQGIEATFPELPILLKPHIGLPERARPKAAYMLSTSDLAMYKAGALQHHHVLRNCVETGKGRAIWLIVAGLRARICTIARRVRSAIAAKTSPR